LGRVHRQSTLNEAAPLALWVVKDSEEGVVESTAIL
jgi:hypothetical protein